VLEKLTSARDLFDANGAYVVSAQGVVVAHASREISSTGANVAFRPYYKNAMGGAANVYAGVGSVSDERGLYYAAPLRNDTRLTSDIIGVVVLKMPTDKIDRLLRFAGRDTLLLSPQGVVFASTRPEWLLHMTPPLDAARIADIRKLRQFGGRFDTQTPGVLPFDLNGLEVPLDGKRHVVLKKFVEWNDPAGPWQVVALHNPGVMVSALQRWTIGLAAFAGLSGVGLLLALVVVGRQRIALATERYNMMGTALEVSPMSVAITGVDGRIEWVNPQFEKDTGYKSQEVLQRHIGQLLAPTEQQQKFPEVAQAVLAGKSWRGELFNKRKDGSLFPGHVLVSPIFGAKGKVTGFVNLQEDTTLAVALQAQLVRAKEAADAANRSKGNFLANMSHEIRTPMNAIIGMAYLAKQSGLNPRQTDYVSKIQQSGQHLLAIIDDILDVSKVEAGKLTLEHIPFELANVLDQVVNVVGGKASAKGLVLTCEVAPDVPHRLLGDPLRLGQILINYANNAVKFTPAGLIRIKVSLQQDRGSVLVLRFAVIDTGIGLSEEQTSRLFQSFEQADTSTTREFGGTGLGLSISKGLAELMGGQVGVDSQPGLGSTFWFTAQLGLAQSFGLPDVADRTEANGMAKLAPLYGARILLVEDNAINQQVASELLQAAGFAVEIADNGQVAVSRVAAMQGRNTPYDLVLMDLQMPVMDGYGATEAIRADPQNARLPIAAMTANAMAEERERCLGVGMNGFIPKPIDPELLWRVIAELIPPRPGLGRVAVGVGVGVANPHQGPGQAFQGSLPDHIDGLDMPSGLRRVLGRKDLYLSLLHKFSTSQAEVLPQLQAALASGDRPLAERLLHTFKGVAGNLGAVRLEKGAEELEFAIHAGQSANLVQDQLATLTQDLNALVQALQHYLPPLATPVATASTRPARAEIAAQCQRLAALLAQQDFEAEELFTGQRSLFDAALGNDSLAIETAINHFNFEQALAELRQACVKNAIEL
jgi:two-component system, sensor histidine kinase and response regulator